MSNAIQMTIGGKIGMLAVGDLQLFIKVAETLNMSEVCRTVGVNASSISVRIAWLEAMLGTKLFLRTTRQMLLTDKGTEILERVEAILACVQDLEDWLPASFEDPNLPYGRYVMGEFTVKGPDGAEIAGKTEFAEAFCKKKTGVWLRAGFNIDGLPAWVREEPIRWTEWPAGAERPEMELAA